MENRSEYIANESKYKNVCIFGQGFVGLPLTLSFALRGCDTIGVDVNSGLVEQINNGITYHTEKFYGTGIQEILRKELKKGKYRVTNNASEAVRKCNNIIVTVGIPVKNGNYNMEDLESACRVIGKNLKKEDLVVIRSTVIPGTTENFILPILEEESAMKAGEEFYLAYSSERIAEGNAFDEFENMPTLVAGINEKSTKKAIGLLSIVCKSEVVPASCIKVVETAKVFENAQRDVNIAMSQEFARFTEGLGIDIFEVIKLANTHKRVNLLTPGPGVGGYCVPNAYHYISHKAEAMGIDMEILKLARRKNAAIPKLIVNKIEELLKEVGKEIKGCTVGVIGLAMKDYSNDDRISPPVDICKLLLEKGAEIRAFDPVVKTYYDFKVNSQEEALRNSDVVVILARQHNIVFDDYEYMAKLMNEKPVCIDAKAVINKTEAEKYGFLYWRL
ncbi:nucleotide sugar dehydrogenase [Clostridium sp. CF012]|uniref:nucleotide sugar dehydrogenase n=1 Tax=Clostridium sp. CF012 TaxID=2843319 RepID=UPI001C0ADBA9|nr:nucleotide sugar dehydrogenase [Clostridium sp. CF012]MBU3142596.1 nucleotide sugar dehydrogenase [Clostridium sp. CF012]